MSDGPRTSRVGCVLGVAVLCAIGACKGWKRQSGVSEPAASLDARTAVALPADGQQAVLREMRQMLGALGGAMAAAAKGDTAALVASLAPAGSAAAADPALESALPAGWKALAERTHGGFDSLTAAVRRTPDRIALEDTVLVRLADLSRTCAACHQTYRVTVR